jgi:hypothetical protein
MKAQIASTTPKGQAPCRNPRSIKLRYGPRCWIKEQEEFAAAAQGDLFDGFKNWDAYVARRGKWSTTRTPYARVDLGGERTVVMRGSSSDKSSHPITLK